MTIMTLNAHPGLAIVAVRLRRLRRRLFGRIRAPFAQLLTVVSEVRIHRARLEAELYRNRYRLRSKNDDDLPIAQ